MQDDTAPENTKKAKKVLLKRLEKYFAPVHLDFKDNC